MKRKPKAKQHVCRSCGYSCDCGAPSEAKCIDCELCAEMGYVIEITEEGPRRIR